MAEDNKFPYFLLGLGVGFVAGILAAPRSGEETMHLIKEKAVEGKDYLLKQQETLKENAQSAVDKGKEAVLRQKEQIAAAYEAGRQAYRESVSGVPAASSPVVGDGEAI
ncbi:MAG: YtxH domain-containing protein [Bryobacterales bacterium]|jgi:gas vesicle protein|nr:YtxH domain-containing protein [Bryobacterales bacterium]